MGNNIIKTKLGDFCKTNENNEEHNNMKELIIQALDDAFTKFKKRIPKTKGKINSLSIKDVNPIDLPSFMEENNIPEDAYFDGADNGYDGWDDILISWDIEVPTDEKDKLEFSRRAFDTAAFREVHDSLTNNGYKRVGFNSGLLKKFKDTTIYDMYIDKNFDLLVEYYSLSFKKS